MQRLWGWDAGFLNQELAIQPMNLVFMAVMDPAVFPDGTPMPITMEYLHQHMADRLGELPSFRWRVERVPFGLHHPVYLEDPDFDLAYHLRHASLPAPGGDREFDRFVCSLAESRLDRGHPLWTMTLVDGLADGHQAIALVCHHCLADGVASYTNLSRIFSGTDHQVLAPPDAWQPDLVPSSLRLTVDAVSDLSRTVPRLVPLLAKTISNLWALRTHRKSAAFNVPRPFADTPPCSLNNAYVADRVYTRASLDLADAKMVKSVAGVSLNDVALAIVSGAFRRYLIARNELPGAPLTASVPVSSEPEDAPSRQSGNRFTGLTTTLATDVADPWKRLMTIADVTKAAKVELDIIGPELLSEWLELFPPWAAEPIARFVHRRRLQRPDKKEMVNVLVSNIRGPGSRWSFGHAVIEDLYLAGPPSNGVGSIVVLWSYADRLEFGILSFADSMADPVGLRAHLRDSLHDLVVAAESRQTSGRAVGG